MPERKNIFLDFMSPDNWKTYITLSSASQNRLIYDLHKSINFSVFITKNHCLMPPAFLMQSKINQKVINSFFPYIEEKLILLPLKEHSLNQYFNKKESEYYSVKDSHKGFYDSFGKKLIEKSRTAIIPRSTSMGMSIAEKWEKISDQSSIWQPIILKMPTVADVMRLTPTILKDKGKSVTLEAIKDELNISNNLNDFIINQAIQHEYLSTYLDEYSCEIISNIPPKPLYTDYLVGGSHKFYDYNLLKEIFDIFEIREVIERAHPETIISIRKTLEYSVFMKEIFELCSKEECNRDDIIYMCKIKRANIKKFPQKLFKRINEYRFLKDVLHAIVEKNNYNTPQTNERKVQMNKSAKVFIVHGHDDVAKLETARFLEKLGLEAIILHEQPNMGLTIIEKLEKYTDVDYAIVLYTPCDEGKAVSDNEYKKRARQNVVFEHGYLVSKLGRDHVCALVKDDTEQPGDLSGIVYIKMDSSWQLEVANNLKAVGYIIDVNKLC